MHKHTQCDVVLTKDCQLVCRHEPNIANTTDAAQKFPNMIRNYTVDGVKEEGVFTNDLTLAQIKTLTAKQRLWFRYVCLVRQWGGSRVVVACLGGVVRGLFMDTRVHAP